MPPTSTTELLTRAVSEVVPRELAEEKLKSGKPLRVYLGIDPTGTRLHLGHSVPLRKLRAFQDAGHHVIFLIGSFTATLGDPSGRDTARPLLSKADVEKNFQTYKEQAKLILDFDKLVIRMNSEWLEPMRLTDVMGLAQHFTIQQMLQRDMFQNRMKKGDPLTPNEFLYPLMQGYDSVILDVDCEIGGNDQLFNMLCGRTLQKAFGKRDKFVLTTKLIEGTDGRKMSKTYNNAIYLTDGPNDMYGKVMSIEDRLIPSYMECCTDIPMAEVSEAEKALKGKKGNPKDLKMRLAREIVTLYHGVAAAAKAEAEFEHVHKEKGTPDDVREARVKKGSLLIDILVAHKFAPSKAEARRLIQQGGVKLNDHTIDSIEAKAEEGILKVGKRKFLKLTV
jgi:tyrosyl-tRNA synthetase